jgi:large subunit ribosomal protein L4e
MKTNILDVNGKKKGDLDLPKFFSSNVREDIIFKILEASRRQALYAPDFMAGRKNSASGKLKHRRGVWKSAYKRGISRIPRKIISKRGSQFNWVGAQVPFAVGGRRAHPPKTLFSGKKINKKELIIALKSALSATANEEYISKKYFTVNEVKNVPIVVESKLLNFKTRDLFKALKKILGEELFSVAIKTKKIRAGKGKRRRGKYKTNAGMLMVIGEEEKLKTNLFDVVSAKNLGVFDLARGGIGRLTIYTEKAIKDLEKRIK